MVYNTMKPFATCVGQKYVSVLFIMALRYLPWFLIQLLVCDAVAFFASIETYKYLPCNFNY